jgi:S1-C subfamily serine protease
MEVRPGGPTARAGIARGDTLVISAGGAGDQAFLTLSPAEALNSLPFPAQLVFQGPDQTRTPAVLETKVKVHNFTVGAQGPEGSSKRRIRT